MFSGTSTGLSRAESSTGASGPAANDQGPNADYIDRYRGNLSFLINDMGLKFMFR
jgi:hypothetical protein